MMHDISDEILSAHIDNELDAGEQAQLLERIATDAATRERACRLWQLKQMLRGAYPLPHQPPAIQARRWGLTSPLWARALAASLLLTFGAISGWVAHGRSESIDFSNGLLTQQINEIRAEGGRVVLHLFSDEPERMETALNTAERLAQSRDNNGQPFRVEFIANGPGLHLLRSGGSPYSERINALRNFDNLRLIACYEAMERMRERGIDVNLLPGIEIASSAEGELAARLTQGWRYLQS